jgi:[ribosomal protein S5]-alanine N-acetyltransferase
LGKQRGAKKMKKPFLIGEKIYLRPLEESDLSLDYLSWLNDSEVCAGNSHAVFPYSEESMASYFKSVNESKDNIVFAIVSKDTDQHIGNAALQSINWVNRSGEFAILVGNKDYWGKGIGYEVCKLLLKHGFQMLNLNRIYCGTFSTNYGMQKIAEKLGMEKEGIRKQAVFKDNQYLDVIEYGILKQNYNG